MDAFYASVEQRDDPALRGKPVVVAWRGARSVVCAASYEARKFGVRSAMPAVRAERLCPQAIFVPPDFGRYKAVSRQVREIFARHTDLIEPLSLDEAYLDVTSSITALPSATATAEAIRAAIREETQLTASAGIAPNKFLAKIASDFRKPRGFSVIGREEAVEFLAPRPVTTIWGVGKAFAATLEADGIRTISQLQQMEENDLMRRYGSIGQRLARLSRGIDDREVHLNDAAKSVSSETTFFEDIWRYDDLVPILRNLSEKVSWRLKKNDIAGQTVVLKMKTADFKLRTRNRKLEDPTQLADRIFRIGLELLEKETDGTKFRLLGIGVTDLGDAARADPPDLIDQQSGRRAAAEAAMDKLRDKFGKKTVETGYTFGGGKRDH